MKTVIIASHNPVKIDATATAFAQLFPDDTFTFESVSARSDVPDQPMSDAETLLGATNRARNARSSITTADYWVGVEGGVEDSPHGMMSFAWVYILGPDKAGQGRSATFFLPPRIISLIRDGHELGEADNIVFGKTNSKQQNGAIGLLTLDNLTRRDLYMPAIITALIPFVHPELYP